MADEEYVVRFTVETAEAIKKHEQLVVSAQSAVAQIRKLAQESGMSVGQASEALTRAAKDNIDRIGNSIKNIRADLRQQLADLKSMGSKDLGLSQGATPDQISQAKTNFAAIQKKAADENIQALRQQQAEWRKYIKDIKDGYGIIAAAEKQRQKMMQASADENIRLGKQHAKDVVQVEKDAVADAKSIRASMQMENKAKAQKEIADAQAIKAAKQALLEAERAYTRESKAGFGLMSESAKAYGAQIAAIKDRIIEISQAQGISYSKAGQQLAVSGTPVNQVTTALKQLNQTGNQTAGIFQRVGNAMQVAFGISIYSMIMKIVNALSSAVQAGYDFAKSTYQLAVGINALRRAGIDITLQDTYENLDKLQKKFGVFSKVELVEGAAAFMNLVRDMGFTKDQIFELQDAVATLAVVNGRAMDDVQRTVALALSSGYTEGLQRLGVSINRVNIALKAEELGYGRVYMTLTETQRAEATQILILEKTALYMDDLIGYQKELPGQIDTLAASTKTLTANIGALLLPMKLVWEWLKNKFLTGIAVVIQSIQSLGQLAWLAAQYVVNAFDLMSRKINFDEYTENIKRAKELTAQAMSDTWSFKIPTDVELAEIADVEKAQKEADQLMDIAGDLATDLLDLQEETAQSLLDTQQEFQDDMAKIEADGAKKRADAWDDYYKKSDDITADAERDARNAREKAARDVVQANRDAANRRAEAEAKYRENQLKAEIDFQERMQKLREGFLMDLEDALHERDARQILRLIRQYNLQRTQAKREYDINLEEMKRAHAAELAEIERQRAERLRVIQEELALKLAAIQEEARIRRQEALLETMEKIDAIKEETRLELEARAAAFEQEKAEIANRFQERLNELVKNLALENKLTSEQLDALAKIYEGVYGPNGRIQAAFDYAMAYMAKWRQMVAQIEASGSFMYNPVKPVTPKPGKPRASGGIDFATSPTNLTIGDAGPEIAYTMPLTRNFSGQSFLNGLPISNGNNAGGAIDISLLLSPDLEARVVRESLNGVAKVLTEVQRTK